MCEEEHNQQVGQQTSYAELEEQNRVLSEQLEAQEEMLRRTTDYVEELQEKLQASKNEVASYSKNLEMKVQARTQQLEEANQSLEKEIKYKQEYAIKLEKANNELNTLMYRASHDLRGPLTNALGLVDLLEETPAETDTYLLGLRKSLDQLFSIVDFLHNVIYYKNLEEAPAILNPHSVLYAAFSGLKTSLGADKARLELEVAAANPCYLLPKAFETLFTELFRNSLQFTPSGRDAHIKVIARHEDEQCIFYVTDNGMGIDNRLKEQLFGMFVRGESNAGNGLGLYLTKSLAEKMHGSITLTDTSGAGSTFKIALPEHKY